MTVWIKRAFDNEMENIRSIFDEFGKLWAALSAPQDMMLVAQGMWDNVTTLYMSLPDETHIASFHGFEPIEANFLPKEALLVHGRKDSFDEQFKLAMK
jgi:hypothetical protein